VGVDHERSSPTLLVEHTVRAAQVARVRTLRVEKPVSVPVGIEVARCREEVGRCRTGRPRGCGYRAPPA